LVYLKHLRWFHSLPIFHLYGCFTGLLDTSSLVFTTGESCYVHLILDLPISLAAYLIGWKYGGLALAWIMVVGTLWWYLLGRGAEFLLDTFVRSLDDSLFLSTQKSAQQTTTSPDQGANQTCAAILRNTRDKRI